LGSVHGLYSSGSYGTVAVTSIVQSYEGGTEFRRVTRIVMARDAIRVGCSSGCRVGSEVFRGSEETRLL
jgi:hypothetical protein